MSPRRSKHQSDFPLFYFKDKREITPTLKPGPVHERDAWKQGENLDCRQIMTNLAD